MRRSAVIVGTIALVCTGSAALSAAPILDPKVEAARQVSVAALHLVRPVIRPLATPDMMKSTTVSIASKYPTFNAANVGKLGMRSGVVLRHVSVPFGTRIPVSLANLGAIFFQAPASTSTSTTTTSSSSSTPPPVSCSTCGSGVATQQWETITSILDTSTGSNGAPASAVCPLSGAVDLNGVPNQGNCNALHAGDTLTISGIGLANLTHEAHLYFLNSGQDFPLNIASWYDVPGSGTSTVVAQVPLNLHGLGNQFGFISLGGLGCACGTSLWTFNWVPIMTKQNLSFDPAAYPPNTFMRGGTYTVLALTSSAQGPLPTSPDIWQASYSGTGDGETDVLFPAYASTAPPMQPFKLQNGWTATGGTSFTSSGSSFPGSGPCSVTQAPANGSTSPATNVVWNYSGGGYITYQLSIEVQGEAGTSPTCNSPVDPQTGAVTGQCQN